MEEEGEMNKNKVSGLMLEIMLVGMLTLAVSTRLPRASGTIYIRGLGIIDNSRTSPSDLVGLNLIFINLYDEGQAYTEQEHRDWLIEAGFENFKRFILSEGGSWITARKPR